MDVNIFICKVILLCTYSVIVAQDERIDINGEELKPLFKTATTDFTYHEVVHPVIYKDNKQLVSTFDQRGHKDDIVIKFTSKDHNFVIPLKRNRELFSASYIEKTYEEDGKYKLRRPHRHKIARHCFYHGHIKGFPHSMVALSTCDGISGYISTGSTSYHLEPAFDIDKTSHRLYNDAHAIHRPSECGAHKLEHSMGLNETVQTEHRKGVLHRTRRAIQEPYDANTRTRYVEMYIVNDFRTYDSNGRDLNRQNRKTQNIANIVSMLYRPFNIYIALVGVENWTSRDRFTISEIANETLENFLHYRRTRINPQHPNDNAQLISDTKFNNGVVGKAIKGTICTYQYSGGVNLNLATEGQTAATIAHELGHNFGMDHDNYTICKCKEEKCIMAATSGGINTPTRWSSCSMLSLQEAFEMGMDYCLRNKPRSQYEGPVCGNSFTEDGEQCDCGLPQECMNKCCNASTCMLTSGSSCASGGCCDLDTCQPKPEATPCRSAVGECDLPEFCWGNSPFCPSDVYLQNGVECMGGQSYCYNGLCKTHTQQCKLLWGKTGRVSDPICFKHLNTNGSKHGNCGYNWTTDRYEPCLRDDVMCGLLHCVHQNEKLMFWKDNLALATPATFLTIGLNTYVCRGAMLDVGLDMPDPGMVPDGAKCEDRKICVDHKCTPLSHMNFASCSDGCSGRGVCNSKGNCHCDEGFGPPTCESGGTGGSIDSGPMTVHDDKSLLIGLLVFFLVIVPLLGLIAFAAYHFRADILAWWNSKISQKHKGQHRPLRPSRPPPKRDHSVNSDEPPPPYPGIVANSHVDANRNHPAMDRHIDRPVRPSAPNPGFAISAPVLTGSTHRETKQHIQTSPVADHRQVRKVPPKKPERPAVQTPEQSRTVELPTSKKQDTDGTKSRFTPFFKVPSFSKSSDSSGAQSPKASFKKEEEIPVENIVKKRELNREISNPVLISTTDRRSKHYCQVEKLRVHQQPAGDNRNVTPPIPPHVSLVRSESDTARRNRPLPPRPVSMPESECGEDIEMNATDSRKSMAGSSPSPRIPQRPPPPPVKPSTDLRQTIEDELSKLDDIQLDVPVDTTHRSEPKTKPDTTHRSEPKTKPKQTVAKAKSDNAKKPMFPSKPNATKTKSEPKSDSSKMEHVQKPIFNPRARPGLSELKTKQSGAKSTGKSNAEQKALLKEPKPAAGARKISTESMDDDPESGSASVSGLTKRFEAQKKPLLSEKKDIKRTQSHGEPKAPMTPPKPRTGVKQIRSVNV